MTSSLAPNDVDRAVFRQPAPGGRGYHEGEVDAFLKDVAAEMRRLAAENQALSEQLQHDDLRGHLRKLEDRCAEAEERARAVQAELEQARASLGRTGAAASAAWPETSANPQVIELAERTAGEFLAEARKECDEVLHKAGTEAGLLVSDAELRASTIAADARHRHAERVMALPAKRAAALDRIEALREEARSRREAINNEMTQRLQDLIGA
ncbi:DivIVA domain-containing protein [Actinoplanes lutulentus]|uniref:Cell wall synthesis protein Wag31 n=1 Tax=Actinoplanes lutulentus TaxID=1287878 RepID=A0A327YYB4_9ACTN|nr:DivIVA domain-containing protein [Actinoplanes lutulentus]MBB2947561.1 DivIVA domain-containing protein [Actinoplanes lutulentus]RAK25717.1 DivIVA domain-containing protein [Actinoplanes lutulentus]